MKHALSALLPLVLATRVFACDLCALYSVTQAEGETGSGLVAGVAEQFTRFGTLQQEGKEVPNPLGQYVNSSISQLSVGYNITDQFGLQANVPIIYRWFKRPEGISMHEGVEAGPGDASLTGSWLAWERERGGTSIRLGLLGGIKFPTGSTRRLREELNEMEAPGVWESGIHGHDLTLGTGSFDGLAGARLFMRWHRYFFAGELQYAIRSKGDYDYRFANDLVWAGGPGRYLRLTDRYSLGFQALVSGETKGRDEFRGTKVPDTGIAAVYLGPQLLFTWKDKLSARLGVDLPVSIDNTAFQIVPDYRVRAALTWRF